MEEKATTPVAASVNPTQANSLRNETVEVIGLSNRDFLERYASPGRVGLSGGITLVDRAISRAERHLDDQGRWSYRSHAFLFQGPRCDGHHWVIESDLHIARKHIRLGVQENRIFRSLGEEHHPRRYFPHAGAARHLSAETARRERQVVRTDRSRPP
jgi:hypothetical protein